MPTLLHLDSSADLTGSASRALTARFAAGWAERGHEIVRRDLFAEQPPHLPTNQLHWAGPYRFGEGEVRAEDEAYQDELIGELLAADVVLIGAPMYNWSVPSTLKAWIDWIHVPGKSAPAGPTEAAPLAGKPVIIASGRGLAYGGDSGNVDHELAALRQCLGASMQMRVLPVLAELTLAPVVPDLNAYADQSAASRAAAEAEIDRLLAELA